MKKLAFFQEDLGVGGIQKSLLNLLRNLDGSEYAVDLYLFSRENFWQEALPENVTVRYLEPCPSFYKYIPFDDAFGRLCGRFEFPEDVYYDLAVDFNSYQPECAAAAICVPAERRVEWVHNDVEIKRKNEWKYRVLHAFFKGKYKYFDGFVCVSGGIVESFRRCAGRLSEDARFAVIPNYIDTEEISRLKREEADGFSPDPACLNFITVGRLCHQKGYDLMLHAFRDASEQRSDLRLYLIGDGPDREKLEKLSAKLGMTGKVFFLGKKDNPFAYLQRADAFVSTSRYEGQGINIMEAMAVGLPVYCTKNLEPYVEGLSGVEDLVSALVSAEKAPKQPDPLTDYNRKILSDVKNLLQ